MKKKKVNQYQCEYCGKKNYSAPHMRKHEDHCTLNPNRKCGMCKVITKWQPHLINKIPIPMEELLSILPEPKYSGTWLGQEAVNGEEINDAIKKLLEVVNNCPACTLAALRQKHICVPLTNFNYKDKYNEFWEEYNKNIDYEF